MTQYPTSLWAPVRSRAAMTPAYVRLLHRPPAAAPRSSMLPLDLCFLKLLVSRIYLSNRAVCHQQPSAPLSFPQCFGGQWHVIRTSVNSGALQWLQRPLLDKRGRAEYDRPRMNVWRAVVCDASRNFCLLIYSQQFCFSMSKLHKYDNDAKCQYSSVEK